MKASRSALLAAALLLAPAGGAETSLRDVYFVTLLREARRGFARFENAAWLVRDADGSERLVTWPPSGLSRSHMWQGAVPAGTVALLHTHPVDGEAEPSKKDIATARRLGIPVYAITRLAVYRAEPNGSISRVASPFWTPKINWALADDPLGASPARIAEAPSGGGPIEGEPAVR